MFKQYYERIVIKDKIWFVCSVDDCDSSELTEEDMVLHVRQHLTPSRRWRQSSCPEPQSSLQTNSWTIEVVEDSDLNNRINCWNRRDNRREGNINSFKAKSKSKLKSKDKPMKIIDIKEEEIEFKRQSIDSIDSMRAIQSLQSLQSLQKLQKLQNRRSDPMPVHLSVAGVAGDGSGRSDRSDRSLAAGLNADSLWSHKWLNGCKANSLSKCLSVRGLSGVSVVTSDSSAGNTFCIERMTDRNVYKWQKESHRSDPNYRGLMSLKGLEEYYRKDVRNNDKYYLCEYTDNCEFKTRRSQQMARHLNCSHIRSRQFRCKIQGCSKVYTNPCNLRQHELNHPCGFGIIPGKQLANICGNKSLNRFWKSVVLNEHKYYKCTFNDCLFQTKSRCIRQHIHNQHLCPNRIRIVGQMDDMDEQYANEDKHCADNEHRETTQQRVQHLIRASDEEIEDFDDDFEEELSEEMDESSEELDQCCERAIDLSDDDIQIIEVIAPALNKRIEPAIAPLGPKIKP